MFDIANKFIEVRDLLAKILLQLETITSKLENIEKMVLFSKMAEDEEKKEEKEETEEETKDEDEKKEE